MYGGMTPEQFTTLKAKLIEGSYICGSKKIDEETLKTYMVVPKVDATYAVYNNKDNFYLVAVDKAPADRSDYVKAP
jgi:hypothetical protein